MRVGVTALAVGLIGLLAAPAAVAAPSADAAGRISSISVSEGEIALTFTGANLPVNTPIDPASVEVSLDGTVVPATAQPVTEAAEVPDRTVMLAMDASGSMAEDGKIEAAKEAATSFLNQLPDEVRAGLVTFAEEAAVVVEPTTNRQQVRRQVNAVAPEGDTAMYDGVLLATDATGSEGIRSVIVLSDGADTVSQATLPATVEGVTAAGVQVDAIALGAGADEAVSALTQITAATGGTVAEAAGAEALAGVFDVAAQAFTNELVVSAEVPADFGAQDATLEITAQAGDTTLSSSAFVTILPGVTEVRPAPAESFGPLAVPPGPEPLPRWALILGIVAVGVGLAGLLFSLFGGTKVDEERTVTGRLSVYSLAGVRPKKESEEFTTTALGSSNAARNAVEFADRMVKKRDLEDDLGNRLDAAGLPLRSAEWVLIHVAITIGSGLLFLLLFGFRIVPALIGVILGVLLPFAYLSIKASRRRGKFSDQLPDTLQLMAGSMSAGYSLPQAVDTVVAEEIDPISSEFNRALVESRLGIPIEDSLDEIAERMQSRDFLWVVMAIRIQRQVGGNLAELLNTVADTLRERAQLRRQVRVLSAEGRLSGWILGAMPIALFFYLLIANPTYISLLWSDVLGLVMLAVAAVLMVIGILWMRKVADVEV